MIRLTIISLGVLALFSFLRSPFFNISKIQINGTSFLSREEVILESSLKMGQNILEVSPSKVASLLMKNPRISSASVRRKLPSTILVTIQERRPLLMVPHGGYYLEVASDGVVLGVSSTMKLATMPILAGVNVESARVGTKIEFPGDEEALSLLDSLTPSFRSRISQVCVTDKGGVEVILPEGVRAIFGFAPAPEMKRKAAIFEALLSKIHEEGRSVRLIDLRTTDRPVVRER